MALKIKLEEKNVTKENPQTNKQKKTLPLYIIRHNMNNIPL